MAIAAAILTIPPSVGAAGAAGARPVETHASLTVAVSTPDTEVGPFATTQPVPAAVDANGGTLIGRALVTFGSLQIALKHAGFTVELVPASDIMVSVDPATGDGAVGGEFTMLWHEHDSEAGTCSVGPFTVEATTSPVGASPYSAASGASTMLDAAPSIPEASGCSGAATVNRALTLPLQPSPAPPPPGAMLEPAITVGASFSPPIQLPAPVMTTTTPTTRGTATPRLASGTVPAVTESSAPRPPLPAPRTSLTAHRRSEHRDSPRKPTSTTTAPTLDESLNGVRNVVPFPDVGTNGTRPSIAPRGRNSAIDPLPVSTEGPSMALVFAGAALLIAAVAFALGFIGRDIRGLIPPRSRHTFGGPVSPRPLPPGPKRPGDVHRHG